MFPKKCMIRFDFPAYGSMPPLKVFWYDSLKEQPKLPGVPDGEFLGDMPSPAVPRVRRRKAHPLADRADAPSKARATKAPAASSRGHKPKRSRSIRRRHYQQR